MRLSVSTRIFLAFAVALVAFGGVSIFAVTRLHRVGRDLELLSEGYMPLTRIVAELDVKDWVSSRLLEAKAMERSTQRAYLAVAEAHFPSVVKEKLAEGRGVVAGARAFAGKSDARFLDEVAGRLDSLSKRWEQYDAASKGLYALLRSDGADPSVVEQKTQEVRTLEHGLSLDVKLLSVRLDGQIRDRVAATERDESRTGVLILVYSLLAIIVGIGAAALSQRLLAPIKTLTEGVKAVAAGDLTRKVNVKSKDEIGLLAREFNTMATSLDRQRHELLRAERLAAVGRISAQITHEIRNPLNSIGLNVELLTEELEGASGEVKGLIQAITREVDRLTGVTEEYLRFARLPRPSLGKEDLNEILEGLLDFVRPELDGARVTLVRELAPGLPPVLADEGQLRAAFLNLVRNSREAMPHGGTLTVRTRPAEGGGVEAEVRDTGAGIPEEDLQRIFDPFYSTKERGTGLGLAFTLQVVQEHGGQIRCESAVGRGTAFTVRLPAAREDRTQAPAAEPAAIV